MQMPGRDTTFKSGYRYGFNGQEKDTNIQEDHYTAEYWEYDSRIVRRWNLDSKPTIGISPYSVFNNNPIWFSDPFGDTIKIYGTAEATNTTLADKGGTADMAQKAILYKDAKLVPAINPKTNQLVGYNVFDIQATDRQMPVLQIEPGDMEAFKTNYNRLFTAQRLYYSSGEPSEGMKKFGAAIDFYNGFNFKLAWSGIKQQNKEAWSDPVFIAQMVVSTAQMGLSIRSGGFSNPEVREWYNTQVRSLNANVPYTLENATFLNAQRNMLKSQARAMMADRQAAALLDKTDPIRPLDYYIEKYSAQGYSGEELWKKIITGAGTPNASVNSKFGIK